MIAIKRRIDERTGEIVRHWWPWELRLMVLIDHVLTVRQQVNCHHYYGTTGVCVYCGQVSTRSELEREDVTR
jgi:hypothetical protein